jgi:hypothetical protein
LGKFAQAQWLFPELGGIDPTAPQPQRLQQLADLMTHPDNGRFTRTVVNRLWHRLMGRGIVHPTDAMQTEPWNQDLLDYLAVHLVDHGYDLQQTLRLIVTSQAYQSQVEAVSEGQDNQGYQYAGPRAKRMTAEQLVDAIWQLTGAAPPAADAQVRRGPTRDDAGGDTTPAQWIWDRAQTTDSPAGQVRVFRKVWDLPQVPERAVAVVSCDNSYRLFLNGRSLHAGDRWESPDLIPLEGLRAGTNELTIVGKNGGTQPNPAALFCQVHYRLPGEDQDRGFGSDDSWEWSSDTSAAEGSDLPRAEEWQPAVVTEHPGLWSAQVEPQIAGLVDRGMGGPEPMVRAGLLKSDFLMRSLGRPNRDQIVTVRPAELTTLEAIDLAIGETLDGYLQTGGQRLAQAGWQDPADMVRWLYHHALGRDPTADELELLTATMAAPIDSTQAADVLWSLVMLPEFQIVR